MTSKSSKYHILDSVHTDPARVKKEREKAQALKKTSWWHALVQKGICHYCEKKFKPPQLTMDHVVPIARGGTSSKGNIVPSCASCNRDKKLETPVDQILETLARERADRAREEDDESSDE